MAARDLQGLTKGPAASAKQDVGGYRTFGAERHELVRGRANLDHFWPPFVAGGATGSIPSRRSMRPLKVGSALNFSSANVSS